MVTTQFRVRRTHRQAHDARANFDDQRMVIPDLVLFVNDSPSASSLRHLFRSSVVSDRLPISIPDTPVTERYQWRLPVRGLHCLRRW